MFWVSFKVFADSLLDSALFAVHEDGASILVEDFYVMGGWDVIAVHIGFLAKPEAIAQSDNSLARPAKFKESAIVSSSPLIGSLPWTT